MDPGVLDDELREREAHPYKIRLEFDRRFKVWVNIIHRNRSFDLLSIQTKGDFESLRERYTSLDIYDSKRLIRRAHKEFVYHSTGASDSDIVSHRQTLLYRLMIIELELKTQLFRYQRIADEYWDIPHSFIYEHIETLLPGGR